MPNSYSMNLRQLEYFIAIADEGSFRAAAEKVRVAPPSLSQQIRVLEAEVGGPLFERLARGSRLTPAGRALLPDARAAVTSARRGGRAARAALALEQAELEVATVLSLAVGLLPGAIERLCLAYPGIAVRLHEYLHRDELVRAVDDGIGDIAVGPAPPSREGPVVELGHESFVAIVGPRHPAFASPGAGARSSDLADDDWILFPAWHGLHGLVSAICAHAGFAPRDAITHRPGRGRRATRSRWPRRRDRAGQHRASSISEAHVRALDPPVFRVLYAYARVGVVAAGESAADGARGGAVAVGAGRLARPRLSTDGRTLHMLKPGKKTSRLTSAG